MSDAKDEKKGGKSKGFGKKIWDASYKGQLSSARSYTMLTAAVVSDKLAVYANGASKKLGSEAFWPSAGDTKDEIEKCARILQTFTRSCSSTRHDEMYLCLNRTRCARDHHKGADGEWAEGQEAAEGAQEDSCVRY